METHVKVLAVLYIVFSVLGTLAAFMVAAVFGVAGVAAVADASGRDAAIALPIIGLTGAALCVFLLAVSIPGLVAGIGLLTYKPWARILTIVLSALNLINVPVGTVLGIYGLYVLLSDAGARLFVAAPTALLALFVLLASPSFAQQGTPDIAFDSVPEFLKLPTGMNFGEVPGVAVNSKGHVFVFTRGNSAGGPAYAPTAAQLLEFGPKGEFLREIGKGLYAWSFAHTVRIDKDDNIWAIDKGSDMIIKFNQAGRVVMTFGRRRESADEDTKPWEHVDPPLPAVDGLFRQPTDVAWDAEGNIYISDGYINSRIAKYDKNGDWVKSWGEKGSGPGQLSTPHTIAIDRNNNVYVGDRANRRIQVFDTDGKLLRMFTIDVPPVAGTRAVNGATPTGARLAAVIGAPNAICITPGPNQVMFVGESTFPGRLFKVSLDGKVLGVIGRSGRQLKQFSGAHQIACPSEHEVFAAETSNWRVQKLILH